MATWVLLGKVMLPLAPPLNPYFMVPAPPVLTVGALYAPPNDCPFEYISNGPERELVPERAATLAYQVGWPAVSYMKLAMNALLP